MPDKTRKLPWARKFLLIALGVFLAVSICEIGLRIVAGLQKRRAREPVAEAGRPDASQFWVTYDEDLGYRLTPGYRSISPDGLKEHPVPPKDGSFRILFLGDSLAYGGRDADDTFVAYTRQELQKRAAPTQVGVINAGIPGYTNWQELGYLKKYGLKFEPDLVGVQFCLNDLPKVLHRFNVQDGRIVPGPWYFTEEAGTVKRPSLLVRLAKRSYLLRWLHEHVRLAKSTLRFVMESGYTFDYRSDLHLAWKDERWPAIERQLREMAELGRVHGFQVFVVAFPVADQYREDYLSRDRAYVLKPQRRLREICARLGIPFYDLYPEMQAAMFEPDGIHLTEKARPVVGGKIASFLIHKELVPRGGRPRLTLTREKKLATGSPGLSAP